MLGKRFLKNPTYNRSNKVGENKNKFLLRLVTDVSVYFTCKIAIVMAAKMMQLNGIFDVQLAILKFTATNANFHFTFNEL